MSSRGVIEKQADGDDVQEACRKGKRRRYIPMSQSHTTGVAAAKAS